MILRNITTTPTIEPLVEPKVKPNTDNPYKPLHKPNPKA